MKLKEINQKMTIRTFEFDVPNATEKLCVDITDDGEMLEAWTYFKNHGSKNHYLGLPYKNNKYGFEETMEIMRYNLESDYLDIFVRHMQDNILLEDFPMFLDHLEHSFKEKCDFLSELEFEEFDNDDCSCPTCRYEKHKKAKGA